MTSGNNNKDFENKIYAKEIDWLLIFLLAKVRVLHLIDLEDSSSVWTWPGLT